jgi:hypothetical protein
MWHPRTRPCGTITFDQICHVSNTHSTTYLAHVSAHMSSQSAHLPRQLAATCLYRPCHVSSCHMSLLQWCHMSLSDSSTCQPSQHATVLAMSLYFHTVCTASCHINTVRTVQLSFFACLEKQTDHDIFRIRCLFDPVQVSLGS